MNKPMVVHPYNGVLLSNEKEQTTAICSTWMDLKGVTSVKKPVLWQFHSYDILKKTKCNDRTRSVVARGRGRRGMQRVTVRGRLLGFWNYFVSCCGCWWLNKPISFFYSLFCIFSYIISTSTVTKENKTTFELKEFSKDIFTFSSLSLHNRIQS